jgi:hypothetical protein
MSAAATAELLKLPLLLQHYSHHKASNKSTGVISFLKAHYNNENERDNNSTEDKQLPFKSPHQAFTQSFVALPVSTLVASLTRPEYFNNPVFKIPDHLKLPAEYLAVICQPPRNC